MNTGHMKRVALVLEATRGGVRRHVYDLAANLPRKKYRVYLLYSNRQADAAWESERIALDKTAPIEMIECPEMERNIGRQDLQAYRHLVKIFREIKPDIVHCHSSKAGLVGRMAAKACGIRTVIYTPHAYAFQMAGISPLKHRIYATAEGLLSRWGTTLTVNVSQGERQEALTCHLDKPEKFALIYNGIPDKRLPDKCELRQRLGLREDAYYIGVTARCTEQKDPMSFLAIAQRIIQRDDGIQFVYIGDGDLLPKMKTWVAKRGLENKIHLLGFHSDAPELVGVLDAYLSTALYEGLPYSMLEAMRAGVPIFATDVVGNSELVLDGQNGYRFSPQDMDRAVDLLLRQKAESMITHDMVRQTFQQKFSLEQMIRETEAIYDAPVARHMRGKSK